MRHIYYILILFIFLGNKGYSQERDFYDYYHWNPELYRNNKIEKCLVTNRDFNDGEFVSEYLEIIELYDTLGRIAVEKEFYDSDTTDGWHIYYNYSSEDRLSETEYYWLDSKDWEKTEYHYDSDGMLNKYCELRKPDRESVYELQDCFKVHRLKNRIVCVTNSDNDTINYFKKKGRKTFRYTKLDSIDTEYIKGHFIMRKYPDKTYFYKRNKAGRIIKTTVFDNKNIKIGETIFEYENGLLLKVISYDENMKLKYQEIYNYYTRENNNH